VQVADIPLHQSATQALHHIAPKQSATQALHHIAPKQSATQALHHIAPKQLLRSYVVKGLGGWLGLWYVARWHSYDSLLRYQPPTPTQL